MQTSFDLGNLYKTYFSKEPYYIDKTYSTDKTLYSNKKDKDSSKQISFNKIGAYGHDVWFPAEFRINGNVEDSLIIDACTIAVNLSKTIIRTAVSERKGTVKEMFNIDDYKFTIRGFLIGKERKVPEGDILKLKKIFETGEPVSLNGGYPEMFLEESNRVAITSLEFPEVQGKAHWIRPFSLTCESDFIADVKDLEVPNNANTNK
ncbi:hypothetical protein SAMN05443633_107154 [Chryseobacterium arachidis]|uniref:DUF6046 domain-containing protein n=1 Tax=Chryseobacterium arachidis TaxID=1416778 RepID=A0A1M5F3T8_9FLAO|nr:DUF6046 domain-containing protein [Chryseobacterium arachidis]SHF86126.1 hypothetical protein SAMN05443633_107154 [Chryseobacterium arachidis]